MTTQANIVSLTDNVYSSRGSCIELWRTAKLAMKCLLDLLIPYKKDRNRKISSAVE